MTVLCCQLALSAITVMFCVVSNQHYVYYFIVFILCEGRGEVLTTVPATTNLNLPCPATTYTSWLYCYTHIAL